MNGLQKRGAKVSVVANLALFLIKLIAGILSNSLAVISDTINSFTDIISSVAILVSIKFAGKKPDKDHPFGHRRAEPIAAIVVAIFAAILGLEIINVAISRIISGDFPEFGWIPIVALGITIMTKAVMTTYFRKIKRKTDSPAIKALMVDCRNDVLASSVALAGVIGAVFNYRIFDSIAALFVAFFIIKQGYTIGKENINYLIGKAPEYLVIEKIRNKAKTVKDVKGLNDLRAHYIGNKLHVEIHIEVNKDLSTKQSHSISKEVQKKIEKMHIVDRAFVHVDPI